MRFFGYSLYHWFLPFDTYWTLGHSFTTYHDIAMNYCYLHYLALTYISYSVFYCSLF